MSEQLREFLEESGRYDTQNNFISSNNKYVGAQGLDPKIIEEIEKMYGFDKPAHIRFLL